ncbi:MAG: ribosome biogenesis GTPase Der [Planctomycetota bacterium]|nr:ribosome biogenesis GTPase Der [Planctomycetota bacterium]
MSDAPVKKSRKGAAAVAARPGLLERQFPAVALVGRPNVGKSSLFNALLKMEISITDARAGTTRDRVLHPISFNGRGCDLLDTGGIGIVDKQDLSDLVERQIDAAIEHATIFVLVVDAKEGLTPLDKQVAARLRKLGRPMVLAANKSEGREASLSAGEFASLGLEPIVQTSALHRLGLDDLGDAIAEHLPEDSDKPPDYEGIPKIAVVGRRNVGKSSFVNALARQNRAIVSDVAGTTRDAVDLLMQKDSRDFVIIDTAGLRRMKEPEGPVEFFAQVRTERAIRRADVVMLMLDHKEGVSTTDRKTVELITEHFKPCVIVVNKWDEVRGVATGDYLNYVAERLPGLRHAPVCFTSAKNGSRCWQTIDVALELYDLSHTHVPTPVLNKAVERAEFEHEPPAKKGRKPRLLYGVQVGAAPPTFVVHCRHPDQIDDKYRKYLDNRLREILGLDEVPLRIFLREAKH